MANCLCLRLIAYINAVTGKSPNSKTLSSQTKGDGERLKPSQRRRAMLYDPKLSPELAH